MKNDLSNKIKTESDIKRLEGQGINVDALKREIARKKESNTVQK